MLNDKLGIRLALWMGKTIPLPPPLEVTEAFARLEVTNDSKTGDGFQITFNLDKGKGLDYSLLQSGLVDPFSRAVIGVIFDIVPQVLIDGIVTHHQLVPGTEPGQATLTVTGKDVSVMLSLEEKNKKFENQPDWLIASGVLAPYAKYGLLPATTPTPDVPLSIDRIPRQHETDLRFLHRLAKRNGFVFYVEPLAFGTSQAYWGPENRLGVPQPALNTDMGHWDNLKQISFSSDGLAPVETQGTLVEPFLKLKIPIPSLPPLRLPPLASSPLPARRKVLLRNTAKQSVSQAAASAVAESTRAPDPVTGQGEIDNQRYRNVLRARRLVGVRGAGHTYDGNYYVRRVTHRISRGEYTQSFTISREGTGALLPAVIP